MNPGALSYAGAFILSAALALFLTPVVLRIAQRREILDHPGAYKKHASPVPYLGGTAVVVAFSVAVILAAVLSAKVPGGVNQLSAVLGCAVVISILGLVDDLRGLNIWLRLAVEVAGALVIWSVGIRIQIFDVAAVDSFLTVLWIVGVTNAFNLLDNMDGLSAGIAAISAGFFFVLAVLNEQILVAGLSAAIAGCAVGFLRHNFHPAKIYMGDAGSLFFGFVLAVIGIKLRFDAPTQITFMVPLLVLGVPIFDTILVVTTRLMHRMSPLSGGRDHTSHRLVFVGIPVPAAVALIYGGEVALGWLAVVMSRVDLTTGFLLMAFVVAVALFFGSLLTFVPVYESSTRRRLMIQAVQEHEVEPVEDETVTTARNVASA